MASRYPERGEFDVVHVGNVCRDVTRDDPRGWRLGGGVAYAALTTARLGLRAAAVVGADGIAAGAAEFELLRAAGVAVQVMPLAQGPIFENVETPSGRVQTYVEPGDPLPVVAILPAWARAPSWLVVPVSDEILPEWAAVVPEQARLTLGWQGLLRVLVAGQRTGRKAPVRSALLSRADIVGVSGEDLGPETSLEAAGVCLTHGSRLVVTEGDAGGVIITAGDRAAGSHLWYRALAARQVDLTGAGDVFLAALAAAPTIRNQPATRDAGLTPDDARWAAAAGALAVEGIGLSAVPDRAAIESRLAGEARRRGV
jgi:sugar/nucleoside kinase (ribokinase family)